MVGTEVTRASADGENARGLRTAGVRLPAGKPRVQRFSVEGLNRGALKAVTRRHRDARVNPNADFVTALSVNGKPWQTIYHNFGELPTLQQLMTLIDRR